MRVFERAVVRYPIGPPYRLVTPGASTGAGLTVEHTYHPDSQDAHLATDGDWNGIGRALRVAVIGHVQVAEALDRLDSMHVLSIDTPKAWDAHRHELAPGRVDVVVLGSRPWHGVHVEVLARMLSDRKLGIVIVASPEDSALLSCFPGVIEQTNGTPPHLMLEIAVSSSAQHTWAQVPPTIPGALSAEEASFEEPPPLEDFYLNCPPLPADAPLDMSVSLPFISDAPSFTEVEISRVSSFAGVATAMTFLLSVFSLLL